MSSLPVAHDAPLTGRKQALRVAHVVYSPSIGGSESLALELCTRLSGASYAPRLAFMYPGRGPLPALAAERGIPVSSIGRTRLARLLWSVFAWRRVRALDVDVLHVHHVPLWELLEQAARRAGVPVVLTEHARYSISRSPRLQESVRRAAARAAGFAVVSEDLARYFIDQLGVPAERIAVVPNGVDTHRFRPRAGASPSSIVGREVRGPFVVNVGRLVEAKDQSNLLRAVRGVLDRRLDVFLAIVGDGEYRDRLLREIGELGLGEHVALLGQRTDVETVLAAADMFVMSSRREGFPVALLEAMSSGLPVVTTAVGGVAEVIENGREGLIVPPEQPAALAAAMAALLADRALRLDMAARARTTVLRRFDIEGTVRAYGAMYARAVAARPRWAPA